MPSMTLADPATLLVGLVGLLTLALKVWALVDASLRPQPAFPAAGKLTKVAWLVILALAVLLSFASPISLFGLAGTVAAIVYLVDVRPAVRPGGPRA